MASLGVVGQEGQRSPFEDVFTNVKAETGAHRERIAKGIKTRGSMVIHISEAGAHRK